MRWGHEEESQNDQAVKIDILEGYIWTLERFRVIRVFFRVSRELREYIWALVRFKGKRGEATRAGCEPPMALVRIGLGEGLRPLFPSPPLVLPFPS